MATCPTPISSAAITRSNWNRRKEPGNPRPQPRSLPSRPKSTGEPHESLAHRRVAHSVSGPLRIPDVCRTVSSLGSRLVVLCLLADGPEHQRFVSARLVLSAQKTAYADAGFQSHPARHRARPGDLDDSRE